MRKTLALATIAVMIALLACSGPASPPDTVRTGPPGEVGSHAGGDNIWGLRSDPDTPTHGNAGLYERVSTAGNDPNHDRGPHPFRYTGI